MMVVDRPVETPGADWLDLTERQLEALQEDAYWLFCQEQEEPVRALRHVMNIVLFEQLDAVRGVVRTGLMTAEEAREAMFSDFALGYLQGLAVAYADAVGVDRQGVHAHAALRDVHGYAFGWVQAAEVMADQTVRRSFDVSGAYAEGMAAAQDDLSAFRRWLNGFEVRITTGLRDGLLRQQGRGPAPVIH